MKKMLFISALLLVVIYPSMVLAGNVYWNSDATFYNQAKWTKPGLPGAKGTASIRYDATNDKWAITLKFSGLLKYKEYIFQISAQDQLMTTIDKYVTSDKSGNINLAYIINNLDGTFENGKSYSDYDSTHDPVYTGYTIFRLLDLSGASGGMKLTDLNDPTNPFTSYPNATMVMRAREDKAYGSLTFWNPNP